MPLNFPNSKKWLVVGLVSAITFVTPFASSILAPGIASLDEEFGNTNLTLGAMTVSIYLLGYTVGPLLLAPLSEIYGRRPVLSISNIFFCCWQIGCALAPNIQSLIVFRFFSGIGGAGCLTLGAGVISDVFRADKRGFAVGIYTLGPLIGEWDSGSWSDGMTDCTVLRSDSWPADWRLPLSNNWMAVGLLDRLHRGRHHCHPYRDLQPRD